jgi:hypothetical protein
VLLDLDVAKFNYFYFEKWRENFPKNHKTFMVFIIFWKKIKKKPNYAKMRLPPPPLKNIFKLKKLI